VHINFIFTDNVHILCALKVVLIVFKTGGMLSQITSIDDIFTSEIFIKLGAIAIVALVPGMIMKKLKQEIKQPSGSWVYNYLCNQ
jgi:hypothetical protein